MGLIRSLVTVAVCGLLGHELEYQTNWAGRWAHKQGWYLYKCRRCRKRLRFEEPLVTGDGWVDLWP